MAQTTKGFRFPVGTDPNNVPADIQRLAEDVDRVPGIEVLTTAQRDALSAAQKWTGRLTWNSSNARLEVWNGAQWQVVPLDQKVGDLLDYKHKIKGTNETLANSTTLQDDNEIFFPVGPNEKWLFSGMLRCYGDAAGDLKLTFEGPTGSAGIFGVVGPEQTDTDTVAQADFKRQNLGDIAIVGLNVVLAVHVFFQGVIRNGGTAGDLKLRWAQNAAHATATEVNPDSFIRAERVA